MKSYKTWLNDAEAIDESSMPDMKTVMKQFANYNKFKRYGIRPTDGLTMEQVKKEFPWILDANVSDAIIGVATNKNKNYLVFYDGTWHNGVWETGIFVKGTWEDGVWKDGVWIDGVWKDGDWKGGTWKKGDWQSSKPKP